MSTMVTMLSPNGKAEVIVCGSMVKAKEAQGYTVKKAEPKSTKQEK